MRTRAAFTLTELLVATAIFVIVGGAMVGLFATSVELYRQGEIQRSANDEAMATLGQLETDLARAIPEAQGGRIYARAGGDGFDYLGVLIQSPNDPTVRDFVIWGTDGSGPIRTLYRKVLSGVLDSDLDTQFNSLETMGSGSVVTRGCLGFGVFLAGTEDLVSSDPTHDYPAPSDPYWMGADPIEGGALWYDTDNNGAYTTIPKPDPSDATLWIPASLSQPDAVRVTFILGGAPDRVAWLRLRQDIDDRATSLPLVGPGAAPSMPGTILRVNNELIGISGATGKTLQVNTDNSQPFDQGPVRWTIAGGYDNGRGVYRTTPANHSRGDFVYFGEQFGLVRNLP